MDFCYASLALLLFMHGCIGQDAPVGDATASPAEETLDFQVVLSPAYTYWLQYLGRAALITCLVTSNAEEPSFKWFHDGVEITDRNSGSRVYIEDSDGQLLLRFARFEDQDDGVYKCEASVGGVKDSRSLTLEILKPLVIRSEKDQHGILGEDGSVMCDATAKPSPLIIWRFANGTKVVNSDKYIIESDRLIVKDLTFEDGVQYICDIIISKTGYNRKLVVDYVVVELPVIDIPPTIEPNNAKEGDEVKIHCKATGTPVPTYSFTKDGSPVPEDQVDATSGIMTIKELTRFDEAVYECTASNVGGSDQKSSPLDVKIPPEITEMPNVGEATEDGLQTIECLAKGDPAPEVTWKKVGMDIDYTETQSHPKITTVSNSLSDAILKEVTSTMVFDGVKPGDAGSYICTASNIVGSDSQEVRMDVRFAPHFDVPFQQEVFYGWTGLNANLTCQASGNPIPQIKFKRSMLDGEANEKWMDIETSPPFSVTQLSLDEPNHISSRSILVFISGQDETLYTKYMCVAENVIKAVNKTIELHQATAPSMPEFTFSNTLSTSVSINIVKPKQDGGQVIESYKYVYHVDGEQADQEEGKVDISGEHTMVTVRSLKPDTTYVFKVMAKNKVGPSSAKTMTVTTNKVSKPAKMSITSGRTSDKATSYNIKWAQPDNGGSPITMFIIRYKQVKISNPESADWTIVDDVDNEFIEKKLEDANARSFELKGLGRDSYYDMRLQAVNVKGESVPEHIVFKTIKGSAGSSSDVTEPKVEEEKEEEGEKGSGSAKKSSSASGSIGDGGAPFLSASLTTVLLAVLAACLSRL